MSRPLRATVRLSASVPPRAALWLWRRDAEDLLRAAGAFERRGDVQSARELRFTAEQLRTAASQVSSDDLFPRIGSAEAVGSETGAGSEVSSSWDSISVAEASEMLGVVQRRVRQLLADGTISGTQRAPGASWRIDRLSVVDLKDSRSERR